MAKTVPDIIEAHGILEVAKAAGVTESHVRVWKTRKSIPPAHWQRLADNSIATLEELAAIAAEKAA